MPGVNAALLGDLSARKELGKVGTQSDIHLHDYRDGDTDVTVIVPDRYPDKLAALSYAVVGADTACLVVDELNARIGEQILAADAAGIRHGVIVLRNYLQPEQVGPLLAGTPLADWHMQVEEDWPAVRSHLASAPVAAKEGECRVPVDHHFDVTGVGAVVLGVVAQGSLRKGDTLHGWPQKVICPVRSIQVHDKDVNEAHAGDRVGLALRNTKAEQLDRGMVLAPPDTELVSKRSGDEASLDLTRSPHCKQPLTAGSVVHVGVGMQFSPLTLSADAPEPGETGTLSGTLEKGLVWSRGERGVVWHLDGGAQRVVGTVRFA